MNFYFAFGFFVSLCILLRWSFSRPSIAYQLHRVRKQTNLNSTVNKTYPKVAPQRLSFRKESKGIRNCHEHVVFTTFKCPKCDRLRETIEENARHIWSSMDRVTFRIIKETKNNKHGVPILKYMYMDMIRECPASKTFTYINGDVLGSYDFVMTIDALLRAGLGDFLMVGRRTNSDWDESYSVLHKNFSFDEHFERGSLFATNAQDYFTVTKNAIDWNAIPSFVIGRPGYDNWLVDYVYHKPKVALVDATRTVRMLHQTDGDGNSAQGGKMVKSSADKEYNRILGKGQWDHGRTTHAEWKTSYDGNGKIVLFGGKETDRKKKDSWVVVVTLSSGFEDMFMNWLSFFRKLNLSMKIIMVAEDAYTFRKFKESYPMMDVLNSSLFEMNQNTSALAYNTNHYKKLVSRRATHLKRVLKTQNKIIYSDIDTVWLADPRPFLTGDYDMWAALDGTNFYCTGFMAFTRTENVLNLITEWERELLQQPQLNQPIFNNLVKKSTIKHKPLPRREFPSGNLYFDEHKQKHVAVVHNNYIVGKDKKIERFKSVGLWGASDESQEVSSFASPPKGTQMGKEQIEEIRSVLPKDGNLLVWGLGNDSPFWHHSTTGKVVFIEDDVPEKKAGTLWFDTITAKYPFLEAYKVHYTTDTVKSYDKYMQHPELWKKDLDIRDQLPDAVRNTCWDVILVDAPLGCCNTGPGRYQSIYTSKLLADTDTHIFVDDYERKVERRFSKKVFKKEPIKTLKRQKGASNANEQAHFLQVSFSTKKQKGSF